MRSDARSVRLGVTLGLVAAALWGLTPVATKGALAGYSPEMINVLRLGAAALAFHALAGRGTLWLPRDRWSWVGGVALGADFVLYNFGLARTSASVSGLVINVEVATTIAFAVWLLGERLDGRRVLGSAVTLVGVVVASGANVAVGDLTAPQNRLGNVMIMLAGTCWSLFAVTQRLAPRRPALVQLLAPILTVAALFTTPLLIARAAWHNAAGLAPTAMLLVLIIFCTVTVYVVYARSQELVAVSTLAIVLATIPVFAVAFAHVLLAERLSWTIALSGAVILAGILIIATERPELHMPSHGSARTVGPPLKE